MSRITQMTAAEAVSRVYRGLTRHRIDDAVLEVNTRTIYVKNTGKEPTRLPLLSDVEFQHRFWVDSCGEGTAQREIMEEVTGSSAAVWSIKFLKG